MCRNIAGVINEASYLNCARQSVMEMFSFFFCYFIFLMFTEIDINF